MKGKIILASQSPRRQELLRLLFDTFEVLVTDVDETLPEGAAPADAVELLARKKAAAALAASAGADCLVIGADTVVAVDGLILGKPRDAADAAGMLRRLSGRTHEVYTGAALYTPAAQRVFHCRTEVTFCALSGEEIAWYVGTGEPSDKAGAYGIQGYGARYVTGIRGDYFNVMGLPVSRLYAEIRQITK